MFRMLNVQHIRHIVEMLNTPKAIQITTTSTQMILLRTFICLREEKKYVFANDKKYAWEFGIWHC